MSYEYLKPEEMPSFRLAKEVGRVEDPPLELSQEDEDRARRLHQESIIVDFHNHLYILPEDMKDIESYARSGRPCTGYDGIKRSGMTACLYGLGGLAARRHSPVPWQFEDLVWDIGMRQADMDHHRDVVMRGYCVDDILEAKRTGRTAIIPHIENSGVIGNELDRLDVLYGLGIRCMGLSYNTRTFLADGVTEDKDGGLSKLGLKAVERMNRLGILIDLSHSSDRSTREAIEVSEAPCCFTHAVAGELFENPKGKSDEVIELLAAKGGVIGMEAVPNIISNKEDQTVFDVIDHVDHAVKLVGVDYVAIGSDAMFGDHVAFHKAIAIPLGLKDMVKKFRAKYIRYVENPGDLPNVTRALVVRGYSDEDIQKIMGGNILRLLKQTIG
jgi:membrane dipeptidase